MYITNTVLLRDSPLCTKGGASPLTENRGGEIILCKFSAEILLNYTKNWCTKDTQTGNSFAVRLAPESERSLNILAAKMLGYCVKSLKRWCYISLALMRCSVL